MSNKNKSATVVKNQNFYKLNKAYIEGKTEQKELASAMTVVGRVNSQHLHPLARAWWCRAQLVDEASRILHRLVVRLPVGAAAVR